MIDAVRETVALRRDLKLIADLVHQNSRVLDIGCGDGALLAYLADVKGVDGRGIELSQSGVNACVRNGLSVIQGDADHDLHAYPDAAFDYVILSQTLQATHRPRDVLQSLVRIGRHAIVSFPNFGYWRVRLGLLLGGRMPRSTLLGYRWYETPNIHLCTVRDFLALAAELELTTEAAQLLDAGGHSIRTGVVGSLANWMAEQAIFMLRAESISGSEPQHPAQTSRDR